MPITNESIVIPVPPEEVFDYLNLRLDRRGGRKRPSHEAGPQVRGGEDRLHRHLHPGPRARGTRLNCRLESGQGLGGVLPGRRRAGEQGVREADAHLATLAEILTEHKERGKPQTETPAYGT